MPMFNPRHITLDLFPFSEDSFTMLLKVLCFLRPFECKIVIKFQLQNKKLHIVYCLLIIGVHSTPSLFNVKYIKF